MFSFEDYEEKYGKNLSKYGIKTPSKSHIKQLRSQQSVTSSLNPLNNALQPSSTAMRQLPLAGKAQMVTFTSTHKTPMTPPKSEKPELAEQDPSSKQSQTPLAGLV